MVSTFVFIYDHWSLSSTTMTTQCSLSCQFVVDIFFRNLCLCVLHAIREHFSFTCLAMTPCRQDRIHGWSTLSLCRCYYEISIIKTDRPIFFFNTSQGQRSEEMLAKGFKPLKQQRGAAVSIDHGVGFSLWPRAEKYIKTKRKNICLESPQIQCYTDKTQNKTTQKNHRSQSEVINHPPEFADAH